MYELLAKSWLTWSSLWVQLFGWPWVGFVIAGLWWLGACWFGTIIVHDLREHTTQEVLRE